MAFDTFNDRKLNKKIPAYSNDFMIFVYDLCK